MLTSNGRHRARRWPDGRDSAKRSRSTQCPGLVHLLPQTVHIAAQVAHVSSQFVEDFVEQFALALVGMFARVADDGQLRAFGVLRNEFRQRFHVDFTLFAENRHLLGDVLQLAHVSRPFVAQHLLGSRLGQRDFRKMVFLRHLQGEKSEQQQNVLATVAQCRHLDGNRVQAIVEVFAETSLADGLLHIHIGRRHDAHVGLHHLLTTHADILARLQHTQQPSLRRQRQFAHFVEENRALVGHTEIALALADGTRERTFFVSEQFAVDGSLGNRAAVDGEIPLTAARRVVVDDARNNLLTHAALAHDEHAQVGRCHLQSDIQRTVQSIAVSHDIIPFFYLL